MAKVGKQGTKNRRLETTRPPVPGDWEVRFGGGTIHVPDSVCWRDNDGGYTFVRDGRMVADFPPVTVSCVLRADPVKATGATVSWFAPPASLGTLTPRQIGDLQDALRKLPGLTWVEVAPPGSVVTEGDAT